MVQKATPTTNTGPTTYVGIPLDQIPAYANKIFEAHVEGKSPYEKISAAAGKQMEGKTDIKFHYARERLDQIFGPHGVGWKLRPDPQFGHINVIVDGTGFLVEYQGWAFWFLAIDGDQSNWIDTSLMSDAHKSYNDLGYAHRGAFTSLMKQALRMFGGIDHIYDGYVDDQGDVVDDPQPPKSQPAKPAAPKGKATAKTGLDKIEDKTPIGSVKWDWLKAADAKSLQEKYSGKTFGDLTGATRKWLAERNPLPFEIAEYLK